ncbi:hypothetical protein PR002_g28566 [Phytophthora rubi]|uniref:Uncharacterized protein n=1 Tax=Phytophthora rubi TaxID=129364 RepID=A0A6A3HAU4_9STRA|nr:hypothetical protein PR002_g28566 [Phytophthora rubi]
MLYCLLQLLSLVFVIVMLKRMIGHSPIQQIAFVLQHQVDWVQMCLVFWLFYNVQGSLRHLGWFAHIHCKFDYYSSNLTSYGWSRRLRLFFQVCVALRFNINGGKLS